MSTSVPRRAVIGRWLVLAALGLLLAGRVAATTVDPPGFPQLVNESDYVIRSVVKSVTSEVRPTANGRKIVTKVELEVREVVAGTPPATVVLEILGGRVGDEEMIVEGAPRFRVGDEDVLFVSGNGKAVCPLFAMMHGRYPVLRDATSGREYMARSNRVPMQAVAEVALPMVEGSAAELQRRMASASQALSPGQFVQQIKLAVDPLYARKLQR